MATMATLFIPAPLRTLCAGEAQVELDAVNVRALIRALEARYPGTAERLVVEDALRPGWAVSVDGVMARGLAAKLQPTSEVHFVPAVGGG
jgi:molybdopterin synthase sulfur carrier subunit